MWAVRLRFDSGFFSRTDCQAESINRTPRTPSTPDIGRTRWSGDRSIRMWWERRRPKPTNGWMCVCVASGERTVLVHVCLSVVSSNPNVGSVQHVPYQVERPTIGTIFTSRHELKRSASNRPTLAVAVGIGCHFSSRTPQSVGANGYAYRTDLVGF